MKRWHKKICRACNRQFRTKQHNRKYCNRHRYTYGAPAVYRFICPDGRCYVGAIKDGQTRDRKGVDRSNSRLLEAFDNHPPETWTFEILEWLPLGCGETEKRIAEQKWIDRIDSMNPERGFNSIPAVRKNEADPKQWQEWLKYGAFDWFRT